MRFSTQALFAVLASPLIALAASTANPFDNPSGGYNITAGQSTTLKWTATTSGTVSLILRSGASNDLIAGTYIARKCILIVRSYVPRIVMLTSLAENITNSGSYTWSVDSTITRGSDYTVEIVDDTDNSQVNFTPYFVIDSTNTVASTTSDIALGAATTAVVSSATSISGATLTGTSTNGGSSASSAVSSADSSISSARSSLSSVVSSASSSASKAASSASSSASKAASSSASSASNTASTTVSGSGAAPTVLPAAGLVGLLALGAFAL